MPKTLPQDDPNLLKAVSRLAKVQMLYGWLLIGLGAFTQLVAGIEHPIAGLPFIAVGVVCLRWGDPALLAAVAVLTALSVLPDLNARATILGPEPLVRVMNLGTVERGALVLGKLLIAYTAVTQFFMFRLLYGTARATSDEPDLPFIPPMVTNRTDRIARWARTVAFVGILSTITSLLLTLVNPTAYLTRVLAETGGSLGAVALGLGLGSAFSPTDERESALWGVGLGAVSYIATAVVLSLLP